MKKLATSLTLTLLLLPTLASIPPITFNLRDSFVETIDEVNSFPLTVDGLIATDATPQGVAKNGDVGLKVRRFK